MVKIHVLHKTQHFLIFQKILHLCVTNYSKIFEYSNILCYLNIFHNTNNIHYLIWSILLRRIIFDIVQNKYSFEHWFTAREILQCFFVENLLLEVLSPSLVGCSTYKKWWQKKNIVIFPKFYQFIQLKTNRVSLNFDDNMLHCLSMNIKTKYY